MNQTNDTFYHVNMSFYCRCRVMVDVALLFSVTVLKTELIAFWNWGYHLAHAALFAARICAELTRKCSGSLDFTVLMDASQSWTECSCQLW